LPTPYPIVAAKNPSRCYASWYAQAPAMVAIAISTSPQARPVMIEKLPRNAENEVGQGL
jgi:hypothetical protein